MNFEPDSDQLMIADTFARFLKTHSAPANVRAALPLGHDPQLWAGLAELGTFLLRVPGDSGGLGLGLMEAALITEQVGISLASGPIIEAICAAGLLARHGGDAAADWIDRLGSGQAIVTMALRDVATDPVQWVPGGAVADAVVALHGDRLVLVTVDKEQRQRALAAFSAEATSNHRGEPKPANLGQQPLAKLRLDGESATVLVSGDPARAGFQAALEEWKLFMAAALAGLSGEAVRLASEYASERKAFGQPIGTYQAISHPLADLKVDADGGKLLVWRAIRAIIDGEEGAAAKVSLALWWNSNVAGRTGLQALHTFGGYGLSTEYDIHLYTVRAKAWPLQLGDPDYLLTEAGRRLYHGETVAMWEPGETAFELDLGDSAKAVAAEVDAFFTAAITPEKRKKMHYSYAGHDPEIQKKLAEAGLLFPGWSKEYGGREAGAYAQSAIGAVWEKHGYTAHAAGTTSMVGFIMQLFGSDDLKKEVLSNVVNGDSVCSLGFSEPGSGSDVFAAQTKATPEGNGWRIDGQKMFTSGADIADYVLMLARTDPEAPKHKGLTMFIVPLKAEGVTIQPVYTFQDERTNITFYDGVSIPDSYRLGEVGGGLKVMSAALLQEHTASFINAQKRLLRMAEAFCRENERGGKPMIANEQTAARLAKVYAHCAVSELITYRAVWSVAEGRPAPAFGPAAKLFSSEKFRSDAADLLDLTAPECLASTDEAAFFINESYRHSQGTTIYGGTSEIHRSMIAERQLGLPRSRA